MSCIISDSKDTTKIITNKFFLEIFQFKFVSYLKFLISSSGLNCLVRSSACSSCQF